MVQMFV